VFQQNTVGRFGMLTHDCLNQLNSAASTAGLQSNALGGACAPKFVLALWHITRSTAPLLRAFALIACPEALKSHQQLPSQHHKVHSRELAGLGSSRAQQPLICADASAIF
jgi:hypothetical protein